MIILPEEKKENQVYYLSPISCFEFLEQTYFDVRLKEGRIYPNDVLAHLPLTGRDHPLYYEWRIREASMKSLIKYFSPYKELEILDLGCGNGWLANQLSNKTENYVFALDINRHELEQGSTVFAANKRLQFIYADIFENVLPQRSFDAVIISSAVQYFEELSILIERLFNLLNITGEIHIIDSNFYKEGELRNARHKTKAYYKKLGYPDMSRFYHHHKWKDLEEYKFQILNKTNYKIGKMMNKIIRINYSPFPWIRIKLKDNI
jgi:ubiquinone/menaquinone biosynthesis C-methylase UbiE